MIFCVAKTLFEGVCKFVSTHI